MTDLTFDCMGTHARIVAGDEATAAAGREFLETFEATLSRFCAESELSRLNAAAATEVPASPLLRTAIAAARWAAEYTGGLVDPTLLAPLEAAGYDRDRRRPELPLAVALEHAPPRRAARPHPAAAWQTLRVTGDAIVRPPGLGLDPGGTAKGLAADLLAARLLRAAEARRPRVTAAQLAGAGRPAAGLLRAAEARRPRVTAAQLAGAGRPAARLLRAAEAGRPRVTAGRLATAPPRRDDASRRWAVDCGGDLRVCAPPDDPFEVDVRHPLTGEAVHRLRLSHGAIATSGLDVRLWRAPDGSPRHHLLDPASGEPAWTGLIGATALAPTALEAEALAKAALLSGPAGAPCWLRRYGGLTVRDDGGVEVFG